MKIVVTGAAGLLGWHFRCHLGALDAYRTTVVALDRAAFNDDKKLAEALHGATAVVHFAGINRASDEDVEHGNASLAQRLVETLHAGDSAPHLIYANTIHKGMDNPYGRGKSRAAALFAQWAGRSGARYTELVLPHVFGECGRPFYNSVVFTFCHQIVLGETLTINPAGQLELLHAQDISARIVEVLERGQVGELRLRGRHIGVAAVAGLLAGMHDSYSNNVIPDLRDRFDLQLFNTLRSFMYPDFYPRVLKMNTDPRGSLFEAVKDRNGGQTFLSTTKPGVTRGNHYHFHKVERFLVVSGQAVIRIRRLFDDKIREFQVSGDQPVYVDMPPLHTHSITNTGSGELMTLFWSHEIFDPDAPDTYAQPVLLDQELK